MPPIGLGCMNLSHAYGTPPPPELAERLLLDALDLGVTLFDTAALYGFGANETLVGRVLKAHRQRIVLCSKGGMAGVMFDDGMKRVIAFWRLVSKCSATRRAERGPRPGSPARARIRKPIKELIEELDAELFWQIHRSTLVNVKAIAGVSRDFRGRQIVAHGALLMPVLLPAIYTAR